MSNYFFKGVNLSQIYVNDGTVNSTGSYVGMPVGKGTFNTFTGMNPTPIGYQFNGTDLANSITANYNLYNIETTGIAYNNTNSTYSGTVTPPSQSKSIRVISVGGGGGGGGAGGNAKTKIIGGSSATGNGGAGGDGGAGNWAYISNTSTQSLPINFNTPIQVTVGTGGNGGSEGKSNSNSTPAGTETTASGQVGGKGNSGNSSYIIINGTQYAVANGGNGGNGGNGAKATSQNVSNSHKGNAGTAGDGGAGLQNNFPILNYGTAGNGGTGYPQTSSINAGNPGANGAVQIIWLYD